MFGTTLILGVHCPFKETIPSYWFLTGFSASNTTTHANIYTRSVSNIASSLIVVVIGLTHTHPSRAAAEGEFLPNTLISSHSGEVVLPCRSKRVGVCMCAASTLCLWMTAACERVWGEETAGRRGGRKELEGVGTPKF